jgi:peptide/nickel transport system permease protein
VLAALARRVLTGVVTLWLVTLVVFCLIHLAPGDALVAAPGEEGPRRLGEQARAEMRALYHLDQPLHRQYLLWLGELARGDLGRSFHDRRPVTEKIGERIGVTVTLNVCSIVLTLLIAVPLGTAAALRPGSMWDRLAAGGTYMLYAVPAFWAGLLLQIVLSVQLGWFPLAGLRSPQHEFLGDLARFGDRALHLVLPVLCLSYGGLAYISRFVRATLIESAAGESWRAARARGLSLPAVMLRHGFRLAGVPLLTLAGFLLPALVGGSVIVETVFAIPGLGRLFVDAAFQRDVPVLMGLTLLSGAATLIGIMLADLAYAGVDPRVRRA